MDRVVADRDAHAEVREAARHRACDKIGTRNLITLRCQHLGNAAHPGAANADEVDAFDLVLHRVGVPRAMHASATRSAASGRATRLAASAISSSEARVHDASRSASRSGVSSTCGIFIAAPASTRNCALAL